MDANVGSVLENGNGTDLERHIALAEIFRGVASSEITILVHKATVRNYRRGATVFRRGERPDGVLVIAEGTLKLAVRGANGEQKVIALVEEGQVCAGALAFLDRPCALEASALSALTVVSVPAKAVFDAMHRDAGLARRVIEHLSHRVLSLIEEVEGITVRRGLQRLAHYVESLTRNGGLGGAHSVCLPATKTVIAAKLGIAKETLSRLLHELVDRGVISVNRRELFILNRAGLAALAAGRMPGNGNGGAQAGAPIAARS